MSHRTRAALSTALPLQRTLSLSAVLFALSAGYGCEEAATGGTGGATSTTTTAATTTTGGGGSADECATPADCPDPDNECLVRLCLDHRCGTLAAAFGTPAAEQSDGDCKRSVCDGSGAKISIDDKDDTLDDGKQCTVDVCKQGSLSHDPAAAGAPCAEAGGKLCDGKGACVACNGDGDCAPGSICVEGACVAPTCNDGVKNGTEVDIDCGGASCAKCAVGKVCAGDADCKSGLCAALVCATTDPVITPISAAGHDRFFNLAFDAQGSIIAVGVSAPGTDAASDFSSIVARFSPQGVLDPTFAANGVFTKNLIAAANGELARGVGFQSNGKIIVSATIEHLGGDARDRDVAFFRLNADGTLDPTFGAGGVSVLDLSTGAVVGAAFSADSVWHFIVQPDDKIVFTGGQVRPGGTDTDFLMMRLLPDGAVDNAFGTAGKVLVDINNVNGNARSITRLADGSLVGSGYMDFGGVGTPVLYKVNAAGVLDPTFGMGGVYNAVVLPSQTEAYAVAVQGNKLITTGYGRANAMTESLDWLSLRFLPNGTLDTTYGENGVARVDVAGYNDQSRYLLVLPDNRVMLSGGARPSANNVDGAIGVLTPSGQPDVSFSPTGVKLFDLGGPNDILWGLELAPSKSYVALTGIKGVAAGGPDNDDTALLLVPIH